MIITHPRDLETETELKGNAAVSIAAPCSAHGQHAANRIYLALQEMGVPAEMRENPEPDFLRSADGPVIIVGNLADNRCIKELYFRSLCATDLWYPGPGGYELRTLCSPFGSGHNVILAGYSDAEGAEAGCREFLSHLGDPLPHLKNLRITRLPLSTTEVEEWRTDPLPDTASEIANTMQGDGVGYLFYLTGEPELGEKYRKAWQAVIACGYEKSESVVQTHLFSLSRFLPWRLVEDMDFFSPEERLAITQFIYGWAESGEGWHHVAHCPRTQRPHNPRQNHEMVPAVALGFVADYFETYFPDVPGPGRWRTQVDRTFEPYGSSWKPLCDGLCHGWWISQPVMLEHALMDPTHRYFEESGARRAAECAMVVINNDGWLPTAGDGDLRRQFPGPSLRIAAAVYGDGRYKFAHDLASPDRRFPWLVSLPRGFDSGIESLVPEDMIGVTTVPVDPLVYYVWERDPELAAEVVTTAPAAPIERCFDKLAVRTGWALADDYLLMDGLGGGSHSYDDAGGIIEYSRLGVSAIVQEDSIIQSAPEHHSVVTIVRDGESGVIPGFAALEADGTSDAGTVYFRVRLTEYAGSDWVREVHLSPGRCAVFVDTVTAHTSGDFAIEAHFRTPSRLKLEHREARGRRRSPCVDEVEIRLESLCDASHLSAAEEPVDLRYPKAKDRARWKDRYRTDEMVLTSFVARETSRLEPGESVRLVHLVQVRAPGEPTIHLSESGNDLLISDGNSQEQLRSFEIRRPSAVGPGKSSSHGESGSRLFFDAGNRITAVCLLDDGSVAVGTEAGTLSQVDADGSRRWTTDLEGPVHDIGVIPEGPLLLAAGHGSANLTGIDPAGEKLWTSQIEYKPSPWPWWELPSPTPVQVAGGGSEEEPFIAVGCGDLQVRCFDTRGKVRWLWRCYAGVPGRMRVFDGDGSGKSRIFVGGEILSCHSPCRILEPDGSLIADLPVEGWTSRLTALVFGAARSRRFLGLGANRGANLHLYEFRNDQWQRNWLKRLGGEAAGICILATVDRVVAGTSQGFLLGYDLDGEQIWHRLFDQAIRHLVPTPTGAEMMVVDASGGIRRVNHFGSMEKMAPLPAPCSIAAVNQAGVYFACNSEIWRFIAH
jgi:hypothetical protein